MFRTLRSVLNHSGVPLRVASKNAKVYRVRFLPAPSKMTITRSVFTISAYTLIGYYWYRSVVAISSDAPLFIPLTFPKLVPSEAYKSGDPEFEELRKFAADSQRVVRARKVFQDKAVKAVKDTFREKLGNEARADGSMLYFHFPVSPPAVYVQKGIQITTTPISTEPGVSILEISYTERKWERDRQLQKNRILYPDWIFTSIYTAAKNIFSVVRGTRYEDEDPIDGLNDAVQYGVGISKWTFFNFKEDLRRTRARKNLPPPRGHIVIDGVVQVISDRMLVVIDMTGSFNPNNMQETTIQRMNVRLLSKIVRRKPAQTKIVTAVTEGLKEDIKKIGTLKQINKQDTKQCKKSMEAKEKHAERHPGPEDRLAELVESKEEKMESRKKEEDLPEGEILRRASGPSDDEPSPRTSETQAAAMTNEKPQAKASPPSPHDE